MSRKASLVLSPSRMLENFKSQYRTMIFQPLHSSNERLSTGLACSHVSVPGVLKSLLLSLHSITLWMFLIDSLCAPEAPVSGILTYSGCFPVHVDVHIQARWNGLSSNRVGDDPFHQAWI